MGTRLNVLLSFTRASHLFNDFPEWSLGVAFLGRMLHLLAREQHDSSSLGGTDSRVDPRVSWPKLMMLCEVFRPGSPVCLYTWSPWRWRWTWDGARGRETLPSSRPPPRCAVLENKAHFPSGVFITVTLGDQADGASLTVGEEAGQVEDSSSEQGGAHSGRQRLMAHLEAAVTELEQTCCIMGKQNQNQAILRWKMLI